MKINRFVLIVIMLVFITGPVNSQTVDLSPEILTFESFIWPSVIPEDCPFKQSKKFNTIKFLGLKSGYRYGDTWYPTWADDGNLYSPYTDRAVNGILSISDADWQDQGTENTTTGHAIITGDDPMKLEVKSLGVEKADAAPYRGRYPCGSLIYNGI